MLNYVKSELYRTRHRKYTYIMIGGGCLLIVAFHILIMIFESVGIVNFSNVEAPAAWILSQVASIGITLTYFCTAVLSECVFSEEYKNNTLKNNVSFGITRSRIFVGKFLAELIVAVITMIALYGMLALCATTLIGFRGHPEQAGPAFALYFSQLLAAFPIWLASLAIAHSIQFTVNSSGMATTLYFIIVLGIPMVYQYLPLVWPEFTLFLPYTLFQRIQMIGKVGDISQILSFWAVGISYAVAAFAIGFILFRKKEIK